LLSWKKQEKKMRVGSTKFVPSPLLVGIESNPGPGFSHYLSTEERWGVVTLRNQLNWTQARIAKHYKVDKKTVMEILKRHRKTGTVDDLRRSGRKRKLSELEEKKIVKQAKKWKSAPQITKNLSKKVNVRTVQRVIQNSGLKWLRVIKVDELTEAQEATRLTYAKEMKGYNWKQVIFSDEKSFWLGSVPTHAWQEPGNRKKVEVKTHTKKIHVWGAMGYYFKTKLYFFEKNLTAALYQTIIKDRLQQKNITYSDDCPQYLREKWIYLQDNDPKHKAKKSMETLKNLIGNRYINHPSKSPDLNPQEDMWSHLERKLQDVNITTIRSLKIFLNKEWKKITWDDIRKSATSMPRRLEECIQLNGKRTSY
jgi:transposase